MFVVWNGLGCLVIPVGAVAFTSLALLGLGWLLNRRQTFGQDQLGNAVQVKEDHSLYWIPVQYWSGIVAAVGFLLILKGK